MEGPSRVHSRSVRRRTKRSVSVPAFAITRTYVFRIHSLLFVSCFFSLYLSSGFHSLRFTRSTCITRTRVAASPRREGIVHSSLLLSLSLCLFSLPFRFFFALFSRLILPLSPFLFAFFQATYVEYTPTILALALCPRLLVSSSSSRPPPCQRSHRRRTATDRKIRARQISVTDRSADSNTDDVRTVGLLRQEDIRSSLEVCERCRDVKKSGTARGGWRTAGKKFGN